MCEEEAWTAVLVVFWSLLLRFGAAAEGGKDMVGPLFLPWVRPVVSCGYFCISTAFRDSLRERRGRDMCYCVAATGLLAAVVGVEIVLRQ